MSGPTAVHPYDAIYDAQKHFRTLLDCTARPGTIGLLEDVELSVPPEVHRATALIALTLFGSDTTFSIIPDPTATASSFLRESTAAIESAIADADFLLLLDPIDPSHLERIRDARTGTLLFPDTAATVIVQVDCISPAPMPHSLRLQMAGPGIEHGSVAFVTGISESFLTARHELNTEFPLGLDMFLACDSLSAGPCILSLPRTTSVSWERT